MSKKKRVFSIKINLFIIIVNNDAKNKAHYLSYFFFLQNHKKSIFKYFKH